MPFTEQQLTSALATKKQKKKTKNKKLVFSSLPLKRQSIYILSQIAQAGRMECSGEQLVDTCVQCYDCADTRSYETDGKLAWFQFNNYFFFFFFFNLFFNDFSDIKALLTLSLHGAVFIRTEAANPTLHFYHQVHVFMRNTCGSQRGNRCNTFF